MYWTYEEMKNKVKNENTKPVVKTDKNQYQDLIEELSALGLEDITATQVGSAISELFPDGTKNVNEDEMLTSVFRQIKCRNTEHKQ